MIQQKVQNFLSSAGMSFEENDFNSLAAQYIKEMELGLNSQTSSLPMIPTYLSIDQPLPINTPCIAIDAGGTNLRIGLISFDHSGTPSITKLSKMSMPGTSGKITKDAFFSMLAEAVAPLCSITDKIGFVFSYAVEILPSKDGKVLSLSKEIEVEGIENELIGKNLCKKLEKLGVTPLPQIIVLNDTAASLLVLKLNASFARDAVPCGFILGTGLNLAYIESNNEIQKQGFSLKEGTQIINTETGAYNLFPRGNLDREFDAAMANPGLQLFEKMISGAYIGPLCATVLKKAAEQNMFTAAVNSRFLSLSGTSTVEISNFLNNGDCPLSDILKKAAAEDKQTTRGIIQQLIRRGAFYSAVATAAAIQKSMKHTSDANKILLSCDGSTFYKLPGFKAFFTAFLEKALPEMPFEIIHTDEAPLLGAAIAGLIN
ncbi:MAG: hypothetical protein JW904_03965 [Spirochaetales bacterium]|nr:hypothetical protein [Spirochaetales bacterium]